MRPLPSPAVPHVFCVNDALGVAARTSNRLIRAHAHLPQVRNVYARQEYLAVNVKVIDSATVPPFGYFYSVSVHARTMRLCRYTVKYQTCSSTYFTLTQAIARAHTGHSLR